MKIMGGSKKAKLKRGSRLSAANDHIRHWKGLEVDSELRDEWLERMNSIPNLRIDMTCAGHPDPRRSRSPWIMVAPFFDKAAAYEFYETKEREEFERRIKESFQDIATIEWLGMPEDNMIGFKIIAITPRMDMTEDQFVAWWETVIQRLELIGA